MNFFPEYRSRLESCRHCMDMGYETDMDAHMDVEFQVEALIAEAEAILRDAS